MNDINNETAKFSMKPNPVLYALEIMRDVLVTGVSVGLVSGIPLIWLALYSERAILLTSALLLITYLFLALVSFIVAYFTARHLLFIVTDKKAIVRFSFWGMTRDGVSIAIEAVEQIEINSYSSNYGSVYLNFDRTPLRQKSKRREFAFSQLKSTQRTSDEVIAVSMPVKRTSSIWGSMNTWPYLLGFYGFAGFEDFANIIDEQKHTLLGQKYMLRKR